MASTSGIRRLAVCVPALVVLLVPFVADAQQTAPAPAPAPSGPPATAPGSPPSTAPAAPTAPGAPLALPGTAPAAPTSPTAPAAPTPTPVPGPAPTPVPFGPPGLAPGGPAASPVVPLPERAAPTPTGPVGSFRYAPTLEAVGPLRVQVFGTVEEEFTDNADQTKHDRRSEFRTRLAPGISARIDRPNTSGVLLYAPQVVLHDAKDATVNHALTLRGRLRPTPFVELSGGDDFTRSDDFRDQTSLGSRRTGSGRRAESFTDNLGSVEAAYTPPNMRAALSYSHHLALSSGDTGEDSQTHVVRPSFAYTAPRWSAGVAYALSRGELSVSSSYWEHTVDGRFTRQLTPALTGVLTGLFTFHDADAAGEDVNIDRGRAGVIWTLGPGRTLEVLAGADVFDPETGGTKVRPSGAFAYAQQFPWLALTAGYQAGFEDRFGTVDATGIAFTQSASVLLTTTTFRRFTGTAALRWTYNDFQSTTATVTSGTKENTYDLELGARYQLLRPLFVYAGYIFTLRSSDDPTAEFTENRVRIGLTYAYDLF